MMMMVLVVHNMKYAKYCYDLHVVTHLILYKVTEISDTISSILQI